LVRRVEEPACREKPTALGVPLEIEDFNKNAALKYGAFRTDLEKTKKPIGSMNTLIDTQGLSLGATLVTSNTKEFK
jgi:predicted nucleic acid-binding protein